MKEKSDELPLILRRRDEARRERAYRRARAKPFPVRVSVAAVAAIVAFVALILFL